MSGPQREALIDLEVDQRDEARADEEREGEREQRQAQTVVLALELG